MRDVRDAAGRVPVLSALGRVNSVQDAERALADGSCDLVGCARGLIAEPNLLVHARAGSEHRSRACTSCNYCLQQTSRGMGMTCAINPATMRERRWSPRMAGTAPVRRRVVVIGGGPAGLEASRMAAQRGHEVTLLERTDALGGQYRMWAKLPGREIVATAIEFYERELPCLGVDVRLGSEASATDVVALGAEAVVVCTGAEYSPDGVSGFSPQPIPGAEQPFVYTPEQILAADHLQRGRVLVLDDEGLNTAVGIAELLARRGAHVELVTRWLHIAHNLADTNELPAITTDLLACGVTLRPRTFVRKISRGEVVIYDVLTDVDQTLADIDSVVLCTLRLPRAELHHELDGAVDQLFVAGDASGTRDHAAAFYEGALFAHMIGQPGAPRNFTEAYYDYAPAAPHPAAPPSGSSGPRASDD